MGDQKAKADNTTKCRLSRNWISPYWPRPRSMRFVPHRILPGSAGELFIGGVTDSAGSIQASFQYRFFRISKPQFKHLLEKKLACIFVVKKKFPQFGHLVMACTKPIKIIIIKYDNANVLVIPFS
jgi:hypothetical protein